MSTGIPEYDELALRIDRVGDDTYQVLATAAGGGRATGDFHCPISRDDLEDFVLNLTRSVRGFGSPQLDRAKQLGKALFDSLIDGDVGDIYYDARGAARASRRGLRISLSMTNAPELVELPWELLHDRRHFLSPSLNSPVVRSLDNLEPSTPAPAEFPLKVLGVVSSPRGVKQLDVAAERAKLGAALCPLIRAGRAQLEWLPSGTFAGLERRIRDPDRLHVIHYIGHGAYDERTSGGILVLEDEAGGPREVTGDDLGACMGDEESLRLVVLNSCEGTRGSHVDPFSGVAQSLLGCGLPAVVGMQAEITDSAAITFSDRLYTRLADGYPIDAALADARSAIFATERNVEFGTPVLFMNVPDGRIFELSGAAEPTPVEPMELTLRPEPARVSRGASVTWHLRIRNADCATLTDVTARDSDGTTRTGPLELLAGASTDEVWTETMDGAGVDECVTVGARNSEGHSVEAEARASVTVVRRTWWPPSGRALAAAAASLVALVVALLLVGGVIGPCGDDEPDFQVYKIGNDVPDLDARGEKIAFLWPVGSAQASSIRRLDLDSRDKTQVAPPAFKHEGIDVGSNELRRAQLVYSACVAPGDCRLYRKPFRGDPRPLPMSGIGCSDTRPSMWSALVLFARGGANCAPQRLMLGRATSRSPKPIAGPTSGADLNDGWAVWLSRDGALVARAVSPASGRLKDAGALRPGPTDAFTPPIVVEEPYVYFVHVQGSQTFIARTRLPLKEGAEIEHYIPREGVEGAEDAPHFAVTGDKLFTTNYPQPDGKSGSRKITRVTHPKFE